MKSTRSSDMAASFPSGVTGLDRPGATNSAATLWDDEEPVTLRPTVPARPRPARCAELTDAHRPTRPVAARRGRLRSRVLADRGQHPVAGLGAFLDCRPVANTVTPGTTQAALLGEDGLIIGVELRGLEPLTPTLPGRLRGVRGGTPKFICAAQEAALSSADPRVRR